MGVIAHKMPFTFKLGDSRVTGSERSKRVVLAGLWRWAITHNHFHKKASKVGF
jgi:hypothetical protein